MFKTVNDLRKEVEKCQQCGLYKTRRRVVLGDNKNNVDIILLGEAPGGKEDETGIPFAADAGKELDKFLAILNLKREQIYIGNAVKCRPTVPSVRARYNGYRNRKPTIKEIRACSKWLDYELKILQPKLIITLGGVPLQRLLNDFRIKVSDYRGIPFYSEAYNCHVFPLYHPASVIYDRKKEELYRHDLEMLKQFLHLNNFV